MRRSSMRGGTRWIAAFPISASIIAKGQGFSYDLEHIGRYYADYVRAMDHFDQVLPGRIHRVIHEQLLDDPEAVVRALLAYLGLPFEPACLDFHRNQRAVRTASSEQVRRPINRDGVGQWRALCRMARPAAAGAGRSDRDLCAGAALARQLRDKNAIVAQNWFRLRPEFRSALLSHLLSCGALHL